MAVRLIINADDFGLTPGIDRAIAELHRAGVLTSATLMANGPAFRDAVELARAQPTLGVGCHIVLTDGLPVSPPESIPSLLDANHRTFIPSLSEFLLAALRGRVRQDDVRREALAQIRQVQQAGILPTHLDTHKHTHILPSIARPLLEAAEEAGISAVRSPFEPRWSLRLGHPRRLRMLSVAATALLKSRFMALPQIATGKVRTTQGTIGISATGRLDEETLRAILQSLPEGTWELVTHPGHNDPDLDRITTRLRQTREVEMRALLDVLGPSGNFSSQPDRLQLIDYSSL